MSKVTTEVLVKFRVTVVHHSSTSTYIPNFIEIEETFCGRTDGRMDGHFPPSLILLGRLLEVDLKNTSTSYMYSPSLSETMSVNCRFKTEILVYDQEISIMKIHLVLNT